MNNRFKNRKIDFEKWLAINHLYIHLQYKSFSEKDRPNREYELFHILLYSNKCILRGINVFMFLFLKSLKFKFGIELLKGWINLHNLSLSFTLEGNPPFN